MCTLWSRHACSPHNQTLNQSWSPQPCNGDNSNIDNGNSNDNPRHQYIMAMMAMATWVKSPCLTRWRGPPESPLELDRGCDIKREGLFVWMANGYLLLLVIVVFFAATIWYYWLSTLQVDRPFSPDMHRIWSEDLKETKRSMCHLFCDNSWILWGACQVVDGGYTNLRVKY